MTSFLYKEGWKINVQYSTHTSYIHPNFNFEILVSRHQSDITAWFDRKRSISVECISHDCKKVYKNLIIICTYIKMIENEK